MKKTDLPEIVQHLIELIGINETIILMKHFGGVDITFPSTHRIGRFHKILKEDSVRKLVEYFGGEKLDYLPKLDTMLAHRRDIEIHNCKALGHSNYKIARDFNLSRRWVQHILQKPRPQATEITNQLSLF